MKCAFTGNTVIDHGMLLCFQAMV